MAGGCPHCAGACATAAVFCSASRPHLFWCHCGLLVRAKGFPAGQGLGENKPQANQTSAILHCTELERTGSAAARWLLFFRVTHHPGDGLQPPPAGMRRDREWRGEKTLLAAFARSLTDPCSSFEPFRFTKKWITSWLSTLV